MKKLLDINTLWMSIGLVFLGLTAYEVVNVAIKEGNKK